ATDVGLAIPFFALSRSAPARVPRFYQLVSSLCSSGLSPLPSCLCSGGSLDPLFSLVVVAAPPRSERYLFSFPIPLGQSPSLLSCFCNAHLPHRTVRLPRHPSRRRRHRTPAPRSWLHPRTLAARRRRR